LNKIQLDEEARNIQKEEIDKLQSELQVARNTNKNTEHELHQARAQVESLTDKLQSTNCDLENVTIKLNALQEMTEQQKSIQAQSEQREKRLKMNNHDNALLAGGRLRFFVETKAATGVIAMKAKCTRDREWLEINDCNGFLRKAGKSHNTQDLLLQKIAETYGIILTYEEEVEKLQKEIRDKQDHLLQVEMKIKYIHERLSVEEESKRRILLRYVNAVKASVSTEEKSIDCGIAPRRISISLPEVSETIVSYFSGLRFLSPQR
jgi:DNA repair exonuclease SbcCD ATPase subunit